MPETSLDELNRRIAAYPKGALAYFQRGFALAADLPEEIRRAVLGAVIANFKRGVRNILVTTLMPITKLPEFESLTH